MDDDDDMLGPFRLSREVSIISACDATTGSIKLFVHRQGKVDGDAVQVRRFETRSRKAQPICKPHHDWPQPRCTLGLICQIVQGLEPPAARRGNPVVGYSTWSLFTISRAHRLLRLRLRFLLRLRLWLLLLLLFLSTHNHALSPTPGTPAARVRIVLTTKKLETYEEEHAALHLAVPGLGLGPHTALPNYSRDIDAQNAAQNAASTAYQAYNHHSYWHRTSASHYTLCGAIRKPSDQRRRRLQNHASEPR